MSANSEDDIVPIGRPSGGPLDDPNPVASPLRMTRRMRRYVQRVRRTGKHHKGSSLVTRTRAAAALTCVTAAVGLVTTGGQAGVAPLSGIPEISTRAVAPDDLAERADTDRASRRIRTDAKRSGAVPSPQTATRAQPTPPKPSPTRTTPTQKPTQKPAAQPAAGWVVPTRGYTVTSGFGQRWGTLHAGVDLAAPSGTPIVAARSGTVSLARWYGGYGYAVKIDHGDGVSTLYGHNSRLLVGSGQRVAAGQRISLMGSTGDSTGPHLHFEVHLGGDPVDPVPYLRQRGIRI
ncbi:MAG TPA: peptidoglycan DD-metalloendopeptidase family protein [Micromonosporaceae bacterium]